MLNSSAKVVMIFEMQKKIIVGGRDCNMFWMEDSKDDLDNLDNKDNWDGVWWEEKAW
jgi:hypothetical protein